MEYLDIVNTNDEVIGISSKEDIYKNKLHHRIVHILIFNNQGQMAIQFRSAECSFCPHHWSTAVGGHIQADETPLNAGLREYQEELGTTSELSFFAKDWYDIDNNPPSKFLYTYKTINNGPFSPDLKAVEKVEFFDLDKIKNMIKSGKKFHPELIFLLKKHFDF